MPNVEPLPNPPPPGSRWEPVERARLKLGWSARKLSREAVKSPSHYTLISKRESWDTTDIATFDKFIAALVRAGVDEHELRGSAAPVATPIFRTAAADLPDALRERATMLVAKGEVMPRQAYAAVDAAAVYESASQSSPPSTLRLVRLAAALLAVDDPGVRDRLSALDDGPTGSTTKHTVRRANTRK